MRPGLRQHSVTCSKKGIEIDIQDESNFTCQNSKEDQDKGNSDEAKSIKA
jgi:hypothetical protein